MGNKAPRIRRNDFGVSLIALWLVPIQNRLKSHSSWWDFPSPIASTRRHAVLFNPNTIYLVGSLAVLLRDP